MNLWKRLIVVSWSDGWECRMIEYVVDVISPRHKIGIKVRLHGPDSVTSPS